MALALQNDFFMLMRAPLTYFFVLVFAFALGLVGTLLATRMVLQWYSDGSSSLRPASAPVSPPVSRMVPGVEC